MARPKNLNLTEHELVVAALITRDWSNKQIASRLHLAESTIKNQILSITDKLDCASRVGVAVWYVRNYEPTQSTERKKIA
jgi:DNA-binding NarL/FixJ family response regulator